MSLPRTLLKRGAAIFATVAVTLLLICIIAGASGMEEQILRGKMNYQERGYGTTLHGMVEAGEIEEEDVPRLLEEHRQTTLERYGLDKPWWGRLIPSLLMVMTFDLGETGGFGGQEIWTAISSAFPNTILLIGASMAVSAPLGILLGASTARKTKSGGGFVSALLSTASYAIPGWLLGYLLIAALIRTWYNQLTFYGGFAWAQGTISFGSVHPVFDFLYHWGLPITSLVIPALGFWTYQTRSILANIAQEEYVTLAEAKGLSRGIVNRRYILRVGLPTILTQVGLILHSTIANSVAVEVIFGWEGLGHLLWRVVWSGSLSTYGSAGLLLGIIYAYALIYASIRFTLEVLYVVLDPRIRY
jgi:peptide/nickel transport system permease protein